MFRRLLFAVCVLAGHRRGWRYNPLTEGVTYRCLRCGIDMP